MINRPLYIFLVSLSVTASTEQNEYIYKTYENLPVFLKTGALKGVIDTFVALDSATKQEIVSAATQFGKDHNKTHYYEVIFNTSMDLFKAMDNAVKQYTKKVEKLFSSKARKYGMLFTVILECLLHVLFESEDLSLINVMVQQWAQQFAKLDEWAQSSFKNEFAHLARDLQDLANSLSKGNKSLDSAPSLLYSYDGSI
ncbi:hypothetical protein RB195_002696 [Necator americanus]